MIKLFVTSVLLWGITCLGSSPSQCQTEGNAPLSIGTSLFHDIEEFSYFGKSAVEQTNDLRYAGSALWSARNAIEVLGDYVYCAMTNGIIIINTSDLANPTQQAQVYLDKFLTELTISDGKLYAGTRDGELIIFDLSSPPSLAKLAEYRTDYGPITSISIRGYLAYLTHSAGLEIIDISKLDSVVTIGFFPTRYNAYAIDFIGDTVILAAIDIWIVDVSSPSAPDSILCFNVPENAMDIQVIDTLVYIAGQSDVQPYMYSEFSVFNIKNLTTPQLLSTYQMSCNIYNVDVIDTLAYLASGESGVVIFNIADPLDIQPVGCFSGTGMTYQLVVSDTIIYVSNFRPMMLESETVGYTDICSNTLYPNLNPSGDFIILNVSNPTSLREVSRVANPDHSTRLSLSGEIAICASDMFGGIMLSRVDEPDTIQFVSTIEVPGYPQATVMRDSLIYIATIDIDTGFIILDVSDIEHPIQIGQCPTPIYAMDLSLSRDYAIIANGYAGISIVDISNAREPLLVSSYDTPCFGLQVETYGDYAFLSDREGGLRIFDISDPYNPQLKSTYSFPDNLSCTYMTLKGNVLCLSLANSKLEFFDVSNPESPELQSAYMCSHTIYGLAMNETLAIISYSDHGIEVIDIRDIKNPTTIGMYDTPGFSMDVAVNDEFLFVADYFGLLRFLHPILSDANGGEGNQTPGETALELLGNYPNPFNSSTTIEFYIPSRSYVSLEVFNGLGQLVAGLIDDILNPGLHRVHFNPSLVGHGLSSGVYIYRVRMEQEVRYRKMIFIK